MCDLVAKSLSHVVTDKVIHRGAPLLKTCGLFLLIQINFHGWFTMFGKR